MLWRLIPFQPHHLQIFSSILLFSVYGFLCCTEAFKYNWSHLFVFVFIFITLEGESKENEIMPFAATSMDLEIIILNEGSQIEKDKYGITYMWNLLK